MRKRPAPGTWRVEQLAGHAAAADVRALPRRVTDRAMDPSVTLLSDALFALVALLHGWFLALEMFLWEKPLNDRS
jgi:hypothetical protein